ncbi:MerR family transcriptional regulator [Streptomyces sp. NPDC091271]|uniref:MerR family transcriptional regulator n=1 Tax=Streptomyces sp. NPDC091271 TaxID=3365980 RepID=UPI0037F9C9F9
MPERNRPPDGHHYTITEVAQLTGLRPHTLRWYEEMGLVTDVGRGPGGRRSYETSHLRWLDFLAQVRETGMTVADLTRYVELVRQGEGEESVAERRALLEAHRCRLDDQSARLARCLRHVDDRLASYGRAEQRLPLTAEQTNVRGGRPDPSASVTGRPAGAPVPAYA